MTTKTIVTATMFTWS